MLLGHFRKVEKKKTSSLAHSVEKEVQLLAIESKTVHQDNLLIFYSLRTPSIHINTFPSLNHI